MSLLLVLSAALAPSLQIGNVTLESPPPYVKSVDAKQVVSHVERVLEWDIRKTTIFFHISEFEFQKSHGLGPGVGAFSKPRLSRIEMGPTVKAENFSGVLAHELAHIVLYQKYKGAIPKWLEEGLANYVGKRTQIDYPALSKEWFASGWRLTQLGHPFRSQSPTLHYRISTAAIVFLSTRCSLPDLLTLSTGSRLERYLGTLCGLKDIDAEFNAWLKIRK